MKRIRNGMILPVLLLLLWYIITRMQVFSPYLLPSPGMVWEALTELAASGELVPVGYFMRAQPVFLHLLLVFAGILTACAASGRHSLNHIMGRY